MNGQIANYLGNLERLEIHSGSVTNSYLTPGLFPPKLQSLTLANQVRFAPNLFPATLKYSKVYFRMIGGLPSLAPCNPDDFDQMTEFLPRALEELWMRCDDIKLKPGIFPPSLKRLYLDARLNASFQDILPSTLEVLGYYQYSPYSIGRDLLPSSLKVLKIFIGSIAIENCYFLLH